MQLAICIEIGIWTYMNHNPYLILDVHHALWLNTRGCLPLSGGEKRAKPSHPMCKLLVRNPWWWKSRRIELPVFAMFWMIKNDWKMIFKTNDKRKHSISQRYGSPHQKNRMTVLDNHCNVLKKLPILAHSDWFMNIQKNPGLYWAKILAHNDTLWCVDTSWHQIGLSAEEVHHLGQGLAHVPLLRSP